MTEDARSSTEETPLRVLWRRRWIVVATTLLVTATAAVVSKSLNPVYSASTRLLVVQAAENQSFDAVQAAQVTARTYATILSSPNLAAETARQIGGGATRDDVESATSFSTVPETQLLEITAEATSAAQAKRIADTFASVFERFAAQRLQPTTKATVRVADAAPLPDGPARPRPTLYTAVAGLLGLLLGLGLALVRDRLDTRLEDGDELQRRFGLATLARVPERTAARESLVAFSEAFRMLRVAVTFSDPLRPPRSVVITSALEGEGKTTTSRHLALAAAEAGQRVIAVEADVYRPSLARALNMPDRGPAAGLTTYLLGRSDLDSIIEPTGAPNLSVVRVGSASVSLANLLESDRGRTLIADLESRADLVLLDCPPTGPRADAAVMAARADATVIVVDLGRVTSRHLQDTLRALRGVSATIPGAVLNRHREHRDAYGSYTSHREDEPAAAGRVPA